MDTVNLFPLSYIEINNHVRHIQFPNLMMGGDGNVDIFVELNNGEMYSFTAFTPDNVKTLMHRDNLHSFISPGLILVQAITVEAVLDAIEQCVASMANGGMPMSHYGVLQR